MTTPTEADRTPSSEQAVVAGRRAEILLAIATEIKRQSAEGIKDRPEGGYYDDGHGQSDVCIDGWFDLVKIAEAVEKVVGK